MTFTVDLLYVSTCQCVLAGHVSLCYIRHIAEAKPITGTSAVAAAAELTHTHTTHTARSLQSMLTKTRMSDWEMIRLFCMTPPFTELPFIFAFLCTAYFTGRSSEGKQGKLLLNNLSERDSKDGPHLDGTSCKYLLQVIVLVANSFLKLV